MAPLVDEFNGELLDMIDYICLVVESTRIIVAYCSVEQLTEIR
jgi:hypothetical protein